jgi:predicted O-linked N-acetylglucosamine transferase (SPINDLY family)
MAGVPVITTTGTRNAENMGASICAAATMKETICNTVDDYIRLAVELAATPEKLTTLKQKLTQKPEILPLFDVQKFVSDLEFKVKEIIC